MYDPEFFQPSYNKTILATQQAGSWVLDAPARDNDTVVIPDMCRFTWGWWLITVGESIQMLWFLCVCNVCLYMWVESRRGTHFHIMVIMVWEKKGGEKGENIHNHSQISLKFTDFMKIHRFHETGVSFHENNVPCVFFS